MIFHFHHQLVDTSQMLESESFITTGMSTMVFPPWHSFKWFIDSQISGIGFLIVLQNINARKRKFLFLYPHSEKTSGPMSSKVDIAKFLRYVMT